MERFALIGMMDNEKRYIQTHPVFRKLTFNWIKNFVLRAGKPRLTGRIFNKEQDTELGYIIDVPGFFMGWDVLSEKKRLKYIQGLLKLVRKKETHIMVIPLLNQLFTKREYDYCINQGFILLDGLNVRLTSQIEAVERLLAILKKKLHTMEVVIWRADTDTGEIWAEFLAPYFNQIILGGWDRERLDRLSEEIINSTGLACRIIDNVQNIPEKHDILVWTDKFDRSLNALSNELIIFSGPLDNNYFNENKNETKSILLESGWIGFPNDIYCGVELDPLEKLGILEGFFFVTSDYYRMTTYTDRIFLEQIMEIRKLCQSYKLNCGGFISINQTVSYNAFRRKYFGKAKEKLYSHNP